MADDGDALVAERGKLPAAARTRSGKEKSSVSSRRARVSRMRSNWSGSRQVSTTQGARRRLSFWNCWPWRKISRGFFELKVPSRETSSRSAASRPLVTR